MSPIEGDAWKIANWLRRHDPLFEHSGLSVIRQARMVAENADLTTSHVLGQWLKATQKSVHDQRGLLAMFHRQLATSE